MIDRPLSSNQYKPSIARREVNKLDTQTRHKGWQKAYRELKRKNPNKSDNWCALQIAKMPIGKGKSQETIRKNMKKCDGISQTRSSKSRIRTSAIFFKTRTVPFFLPFSN